MSDEQLPLAINQSAIALIRRWFDDQPRWLVIADAITKQHALIEAARLEEESFRESIDREIAWQLNLQRSKDYIISSVPRLHLEIPIEITHGCRDGEEQRIDVIEFYLIELYGKQARQTLDANPQVHWWKVENFFADDPLQGLPSRQQQVLQIADIMNEDRSNG